MVLPIIIAAGITVFAITVKSGLRAWDVYRRLTPAMIARLNKINVEYKDFYNPSSKYRSYLPEHLRQQLEQYQGGFNKKMNEMEAMMILSITSDEIKYLDDKMLKKKHRTSMIMNHPDKGGSPYVAMKINEAKELLEKSSLLRRY
ncbi:Mdj2p Ecym_2012 [Eremothecium cymbalariae DBVPG|uniref:J domain-containing protein n=1 Tax=Eremothecium cymbalariae (strain CBS 270.75 / DBVPG 7215 / KCTC 17166 / NRRL Y-17582) TaxID=931890 RepID=G8JNX1_ERECY|nr:Hypothetical protein Ecym_2012 [Eremothecium cymbalariae DBVPG\